MTAPELSPDEQIVLAHYEAQPAAPESFRLVLARELYAMDAKWYELDEADQALDYGMYEDVADRAIEVMRGERDLATDTRWHDESRLMNGDPPRAHRMWWEQ
jgi:hypothetical protein